jgi:Leucine-rich repeat (LRR) protein
MNRSHKIFTLPNEILLEEIIMNNLDPQSIVSICSSNKSFRELCNNDDFWKELYLGYYGDTGMSSAGYFSSWYNLFKKCYALEELLLYPVFNDFDMKELFQTHVLVIENRNLKIIPREIRELYMLTELVLSYNIIKKIPNEIGKLIGLTVLNLQRNNIEHLPKEIGKLFSMENNSATNVSNADILS